MTKGDLAADLGLNFSQPLRSVLFVPANAPRHLAKLKDIDCDAVIYDLEDAVGVSDKSRALDTLIEHLEGLGTVSRQAFVRIDLKDAVHILGCLKPFMLKKSLQAIVVPKVSEASDLEAISAYIPQGMGLWAMIETAKGVVNLKSICATKTLTGLILGPNDLRAELRVEATPDRHELMFILSQIVLFGRAYGLRVLDGVYNQFTDEAGFIHEATHAKALGFEGKTLIHPAQIAPLKAVFKPSEAELAWAKRLIEAFEGSDKGVMALEGHMVERMHLEAAKRLMKIV
jgi:citrate lyase beta subunit